MQELATSSGSAAYDIGSQGETIKIGGDIKNKNKNKNKNKSQKASAYRWINSQRRAHHKQYLSFVLILAQWIEEGGWESTAVQHCSGLNT